jgi:hypothetical protein
MVSARFVNRSRSLSSFAPPRENAPHPCPSARFRLFQYVSTSCRSTTCKLCICFRPIRRLSYNHGKEGHSLLRYIQFKGENLHLRAIFSKSPTGGISRWGIAIEIAIGIERGRKVHGPWTREIERLPAGDPLRCLGLRECRRPRQTGAATSRLREGRKPIPIAIAIWMRPSPNNAVEATEYRASAALLAKRTERVAG